eukprot:7381775-Prymnesium_polylepis.3
MSMTESGLPATSFSNSETRSVLPKARVSAADGASSGSYRVRRSMYLCPTAGAAASQLANCIARWTAAAVLCTSLTRPEVRAAVAVTCVAPHSVVALASPTSSRTRAEAASSAAAIANVDASPAIR